MSVAALAPNPSLKRTRVGVPVNSNVGHLIMSRIIILCVALLQTTTAFACSDGSSYDLSFTHALAFLLAACLGFVVAVVLRVLRKAFSLRLPIAALAVSAVLPTLEWLRWGNGDCGLGFVDASKLCALTISFYGMYELVRFYHATGGNRGSGDA